MKAILPLGLLACLAAGQASATCGPIMVSPVPDSPDLVVDFPFMDVAAPPWMADQVYHAGDLVLHTGGIYVARWWTQNEEPGPGWASWELITRKNDHWNSDAVYNQGDTVLFGGKIYEAQYWTQGQKPGESGSWAVAEVTTKMQSAQFTKETYDCGAPPIMNPDGSYYYTRHYFRHISLESEVTDEVIFDHVRIKENGTTSEEKITAVIDGQTCEGQVACNALLAGEAKQVSYYSMVNDSYTKTYGSIQVTPTPTPLPPIPTMEVSPGADARLSPPPTVTPTPPVERFALICNLDEVCRKIELNW